MRTFAIALPIGVAGILGSSLAAQQSCKVCADQQKACMNNYAGPTCKSEYQKCMKSCGKRS